MGYTLRVRHVLGAGFRVSVDVIVGRACDCGRGEGSFCGSG